jgi:surface protein
MKTMLDYSSLRMLINKGISTEELNSKYDYSEVTEMDYLLNGSLITEIPFLDTSNVVSMYCMFLNCKSLKSIPLLDTSKVFNMSNMFRDCKSIKSIPLLDTSKVVNMLGMFISCNSLESVPNLDTSNVNLMGSMFWNCSSLKDINPYNFKLDVLKGLEGLDNKFIKEKYPELFI